MKKMLTSFVITGALTIGNISAVASEYIENTINIITQIDSKEKIKKNSSQISKYLGLLEQSDKEFHEKVISFMLDNYKRLGSQEFGKQLGNIALAIKGKDIRYDAMLKTLKKDKKLIVHNKKILELRKSNKLIKNKIQEVINLVFLHIEAKGIFDIANAILQSENINDITLKDFFYTSEIENEDKPLFISINQEENINLESIYSLEDEINEYIEKTTHIKKDTYSKLGLNSNLKIDEYSFEAMRKSYFKRASIV